MSGKIQIRFYEELNDFLPVKRKKVQFEHSFFGQPTIKDIIESLGVPHTEIDLILADGKSVDFSYIPKENILISVYPVFESIDIKDVTLLHPEPLRTIRFILDVHLGKLARYLRVLGFDTVYENDLQDNVIIEKALEEERIILTRDIGILKNGKVTHGYWIRSQNSREQLKEVVQRFDLHDRFKPFARCTNCNSLIDPIEKEEVVKLLKPRTKKEFQNFYQCTGCKKIYWHGSHYEDMMRFIDSFVEG